MIPNLSRNMSSLAVAGVVQMTSTNNLSHNLARAAELVSQAKQRGASMVFLPEACDFIGENRRETLELSQPLNGSTVQHFREVALTNDVWLSVGGLHTVTEAEGDPEKINNTHLIINPKGEILETYNKTHLFDVNIPGSVALTESSYVTPGCRLSPPVETPLGRLGLGVCYDLRFAEFSQSLVQAGADILTFPSAFTVKTGSAHWETLLRARAVETQCYVIAAAQTGRHSEKRTSWGHSLIVSPWGQVLADAGQEGEKVVTAEIDLKFLETVRRNMPVQLHRRHGLYGSLSPAQTVPDHLQPDFTFGPVTVPGGAIFLRSPLSVAFVNKKPVVEGHVLVSPVRKVAQLAELNHQEVTDLFLLVQTVEKFLEKYYNVTSTTISIQNGVLAGQSIPHLHVHILPRRPGDFADNDDVYRELQSHDKQTSGWRSEQQMVEEATLFRNALKTGC